MDSNDPLAPYRRKEPQPVSIGQAQQPLTERQALKLAIEALNEVPNSRVRMEGYTDTYKLIPDLEKAYQAGEDHARLKALASKMYDTLLLCEDALTELGRTDDGTPSIQALIDIKVIKKEAGYPLPGPDLQQELEKSAGNLSEEQVIKWMQGTLIQAPAEPGTKAKDDATMALLDVAKAAWQQSCADNEQLRAINAELLQALENLLSVEELNGGEIYDGTARRMEEASSAIAKAQPEQQLGSEQNVPRSVAAMTDAEIEAAAKHDIKLWEDARSARLREIDVEPER
ncbi:MAG TPA: hypothetical protein VFV38_09930 [Ktedonobacteraceae bacterium]|nr:hypothetical protein [Ktedonobacteraceae bacterium]